MPIVSIIIPTRNRSQYLLERLRVLERSTPEIHTGEAEVIISLDEDDVKTCEVIDTYFPKFRIHFNPRLEFPCNKWNEAAQKYKESKWLVTMSDDSICHPNWLTNALNMISRGFIGFPDGVTGNRNNVFTPLYMATRSWLKYYNGGVLVIPVYKSWCADMEIGARAQKSGTYMISEKSVVEQLHVDFGTAPNDSMYELGKTRRIEDYKLYEKRKALGFPDDFEGVLI